MDKIKLCQIVGFACAVVVFVANVITTKANNVWLDEKIRQKIAKQLNK